MNFQKTLLLAFGVLLACGGSAEAMDRCGKRHGHGRGRAHHRAINTTTTAAAASVATAPSHAKTIEMNKAAMKFIHETAGLDELMEEVIHFQKNGFIKRFPNQRGQGCLTGLVQEILNLRDLPLNDEGVAILRKAIQTIKGHSPITGRNLEQQLNSRLRGYEDRRPAASGSAHDLKHEKDAYADRGDDVALGGHPDAAGSGDVSDADSDAHSGAAHSRAATDAAHSVVRSDANSRTVFDAARSVSGGTHASALAPASGGHVRFDSRPAMAPAIGAGGHDDANSVDGNRDASATGSASAAVVRARTSGGAASALHSSAARANGATAGSLPNSAQ